MSFEPRNLLVTGGAGFIGANFVHHWLRNSTQGALVILDALTYAGNRASLSLIETDARLTFVQGDVCDADLVRRVMGSHDIDTLVHFAAESHVDRSILGPDEFVRTNVVGTHTLLKVAKEFWLGGVTSKPHRFHHVSTDEVYGSLRLDEPAFHEGTPYAPNSPYSASKAGSDHLVRAYHETFGLATTVTNCSNNYGPYQFPEKLVPLTIVNILAGRTLPVYGDGLQIRDWLHVDDHCRAIALAIRHGIAGQVYNIGGDSETTNIDIVRQLCDMVDATFKADPKLRQQYPASPAAANESSQRLIKHVRDRQGHDRRYAVDFTRARRDLQYEPSFDVISGLKATLAWYLGHTEWWRPLLSPDYQAWIDTNYRP